MIFFCLIGENTPPPSHVFPPNVMMEVVCFLETLLPTYQNRGCHNLEDHTQ